MTSEAQRGKTEEKSGLRQPTKHLCASKEVRKWGIVERERVFANCISLLCQHPNYLKEITQLKMGQRPEDSFLKETHSRAAAPWRDWPMHSSREQRSVAKSHLMPVRTADSEGTPRRQQVLAKVWGLCRWWYASCGDSTGASPKLKTGLPWYETAPLLGIYSKELKSRSQTGILIFVAAVFTLTKLPDSLFVPG